MHPRARAGINLSHLSRHICHICDIPRTPSHHCYKHRYRLLLLPFGFRGGTYSGIHASGFRDFLLKPELLRAVVDCGFEQCADASNPSPSSCISDEMNPAGAAQRFLSAFLPAVFLSFRFFGVQPVRGAARVHPASYPRHGRALPGQEWHGQDRRFRPLIASPTRGQGRLCRRSCPLPHARGARPPNPTNKRLRRRHSPD